LARGDLYGAALTVEFLERLRDQRRFDSASELSAAMRADIAAARRIANEYESRTSQPRPDDANAWEENPIAGIVGSLLDVITLGATEAGRDLLDDGTPVVEDPSTLEAAERAVADLQPPDAYAAFDESWIEVLGPVSLVNVTARLRSFEITSPLSAEDIPFAWDPLPPEELTTVRPELVSAQRFHLYVPQEHAARARELVAWWDAKAP